MRPWFRPSPDTPVGDRIKTYTPEECGWVRMGLKQWELPNGAIYLFPPGAPELVARLEESE